MELRDRLLRSVVVVAALLLVLFPFADKLFSVLAKPVLPYLPEGASLIATGPISPFWIPFKSTLVAAIFIAQAYGLELTFATQFVIVVTALVTSIGVAGIPSASLVV